MKIVENRWKLMEIVEKSLNIVENHKKSLINVARARVRARVRAYTRVRASARVRACARAFPGAQNHWLGG